MHWHELTIASYDSDKVYSIMYLYVEYIQLVNGLDTCMSVLYIWCSYN